MSVPALLDHVVIAGPDLDELVAWFAGATGVTAAPGGVHASTGTANALVALTVEGERRPHYVELIAPDPDGTVEAVKFGIPGLTAPRVVTYAVHPPDLDAVVAASRARGYDPGPVEDLSRRTRTARCCGGG
ncbi:VOC family protein [Kineococcus terrestris]|uniref:VOC family protein n=1 Tax=Kineococcus terrestris TaxID=2044856 RepID=UPI0034DAEF2E